MNASLEVNPAAGDYTEIPNPMESYYVLRNPEADNTSGPTRLVIVFPGFCEGSIEGKRGNVQQVVDRYATSPIPKGTAVVFIDTTNYPTLPFDATTKDNTGEHPTMALGQGLMGRVFDSLTEDDSEDKKYLGGVGELVLVGSSLGGLTVEGALHELDNRKTNNDAFLPKLRTIDVDKYTPAGELKHYEKLSERAMQAKGMLDGMGIELSDMFIDASLRALAHEKGSPEYEKAIADMKVGPYIARTAIHAVLDHLWKHPRLLSKVLTELPASHGYTGLTDVCNIPVNRTVIIADGDQEFPQIDRRELMKGEEVVTIPGRHGSFAHSDGFEVLRAIVDGTDNLENTGLGREIAPYSRIAGYLIRGLVRPPRF
jgi:hypothetical protein